MNKNKTYIFSGAILIIVMSFIFFGHGPVCPDDFTNDDAQLSAMNSWTNSFFDSHPDATMTDWANARHQFYVDNKCTISLQRYEDAKNGKADPETMKRVDNAIQEVINDHTQ
jgi:hypothetical protein